MPSVPKRRGKGRSYGAGEAGEAGEGGGDGTGTAATVTVIWYGLMVTTLMPAGTNTAMLTAWLPTSMLPTDTLPTSEDVSKAFREAIAPPRVTITLGVESV